MNSRLLHFLFVLACAALIGLGPLRAQNPTSSSDANGSAVTAPASSPDASHSAVAPSSAPDANNARGSDHNADARRAADAAVANDRGTVPENQASPSRWSAGWVGLLGLLGLLGLVRPGARRSRNLTRTEAPREDYRRAA